MEIKGKVALITGASQGIGKSTAVALAKEGASVIINFKFNEKLASDVLKECNKYSKNDIIIRTDITIENDVKEMLNKIFKKFNKLDILINNAGIFDEEDNPTNIKSFENTFNVNFLAQVRVTKHALEIMKVGKIINVSSVHGKIGHGRVGAIAYSSMKAALDSYTINIS